MDTNAIAKVTNCGAKLQTEETTTPSEKDKKMPCVMPVTDHGLSSDFRLEDNDRRTKPSQKKISRAEHNTRHSLFIWTILFEFNFTITNMSVL